MAQSILQTPFWAEFKAKSGWKQFEIAQASVLVKKVYKNLAMAYVPEVSDKDWKKWLPEFHEGMKELAKREKLIFAKLEVWEDSENKELIQLLKKNGLKKSFEFVQPEHRRVIDISGTTEEILAQMKQKGRYNIKVAKKHGVEVEVRADLANLKEDTKLAYDLIAGTGDRKNFGVRQKPYFDDLIETLYKNNAGAVFIARYEGQPVVALIISFWDGVASYLYGGSSTEHKETMAPYLTHLEVIEEAKRRGCQVYDMLGAAPPDQPNHPYAGFARFKEQFGGSYVHLVGSFDLIFKPFWYKMFCLAEKYRRRGVI